VLARKSVALASEPGKNKEDVAMDFLMNDLLFDMVCLYLAKNLKLIQD